MFRPKASALVLWRSTGEGCSKFIDEMERFLLLMGERSKGCRDEEVAEGGAEEAEGEMCDKREAEAKEGNGPCSL